MYNLIRPLKGAAVGKEKFSVCDIENQETGEVLAIGLSYREINEEINHVVFSDWKEFTDYIARNSARLDCLSRIWAHNGGGWDWCSYFAWLLKNKHAYEGLEIFPVIVGSKYVVIQLDFGVVYENNPDKPEAGIMRKVLYSMKLCDSMYLLRSSLDKLSKSFLGRGKVDTGGMMAWELWENDRSKFYEYLEIDCKNLLEILEKFYSTIREHIAPLDKLGSTIGSTALRLYRHCMPVVGRVREWSAESNETKITEKKLIIEIPTDAKGHKELRAFFREAYFGGRVEVFKYGHFKNVRVYDINSLYPFVMREHTFPCSPRTYDYSSSQLPYGVNGVFKVIFNQTNKIAPPVLTIAGKSCYTGSGTFFSPELNLLRKVGGEIHVEKGYIFQDCKPIFRDYINKMWELRKSDYKGALGMVCKFLMNSLYGKFCERPKTDKLMILGGTVWENMQQIIKHEFHENQIRKEKNVGKISVDIIDESQGCYLIHDEDAICSNEHVGIGGLITSWARVELYLRFLETGFKNLIYSDTDSIHTFGTCKIGEELGELKLEHDGEGVYCGKKLYALKHNSDCECSECLKIGRPYEKITAKGVAFCSNRVSMGDFAGVKDRHKFLLTFDDMVKIHDGNSILCEFSQPASAKEILRGKNECQILRYENSVIKHNRKRTLRKT